MTRRSDTRRVSHRANNVASSETVSAPRERMRRRAWCDWRVIRGATLGTDLAISVPAMATLETVRLRACVLFGLVGGIVVVCLV